MHQVKMSDLIKEIPIQHKKENTEKKSRLRPWPSKEKYLHLKNETIKEWKPVFRQLIEETPDLFTDLNENQAEDLSELMSLFVHGVKMTFRRTRWADGEASMFISADGLDNDIPMGIILDVDNPEFAINPFELCKLIKRLGKTDRINGVAGGMEKPTLEDMFEIGGVEEGDHLIFLKTRKSVGKSALPDRGFGYEYHTSDIEYTALLRKLSYAKKFKPEYVDDLDTIRFQAKMARNESRY